MWTPCAIRHEDHERGVTERPSARVPYSELVVNSATTGAATVIFREHAKDFHDSTGRPVFTHESTCVLNGWRTICYGYSKATISDHFQIIVVVAYSHYFLCAQSKTSAERHHGVTLRAQGMSYFDVPAP